MKLIYSVLFALGLMNSPAHAKMELEDSYFVGNSQLYPGADEEWSSGQDMGEVGFGHYQFQMNGTIVIKSFDADTYAKQIIKIPAQLKWDAWGAIAVARIFSDGFTLDITGLKNKMVSRIFGNYAGGQAGLSVILSLGYKQICNGNFVCLDGWNNAVPGLGLNISYISATLSPGHFVPGKTTVINATVETNSPTGTTTIEMPISQVKQITL